MGVVGGVIVFMVVVFLVVGVGVIDGVGFYEMGFFFKLFGLFVFIGLFGFCYFGYVVFLNIYLLLWNRNDYNKVLGVRCVFMLI